MPQPTQLGDHRSDPIGLLAADEADPDDRRGAGREGGDDGERLGGVGAVAQVDLDAAQLGPAAHLHPPRGPLHRRSHRLQRVEEGQVALQGGGAEPLHPDPPPDDRCGGEGVGRGGRVGFDLVARRCPVPPGLDLDPLPLACAGRGRRTPP